MGIVLLVMFMGITYIRPMDWWGPVRGLPLANACAIATLVACIPRILHQRQVIGSVPELRVAIAFLLGATFSGLGSSYGWQGVSAFQEVGKLIVLYALVILLARDRRFFRCLLWTILLCVTWMAVHGIMQAHLGSGFGGQRPLMPNIIRGEHTIRIIAFGIFADPNVLCLSFVVAIPLLYAVFRSTTDLVPKVLSLSLIPLLVYGAWLTNSRGGVIAVMAMLGAYALVRTRGVPRWTIVASGCLLALMLAPSRFSSGLEVETGRVTAWQDGMAAFVAQPLFGVGFGNFLEISSLKLVAHNSYIHALAELGLVGYVPYFLLLYLTLLHLWRATRIPELAHTPDHYLLSGLFAALVGYVTGTYFVSQTYNPVPLVLSALAVSEVIMARRTDEALRHVFGRVRRDVGLGLLWCALSLIVFWVSIAIARVIGRS